MGHHSHVCSAARYDETSFASLPQLGPEGHRPDEEGGRTDKYCRPAEDGKENHLKALSLDTEYA